MYLFFVIDIFSPKIQIIFEVVWWRCTFVLEFNYSRLILVNEKVEVIYIIYIPVVWFCMCVRWVIGAKFSKPEIHKTNYFHNIKIYMCIKLIASCQTCSFSDFLSVTCLLLLTIRACFMHRIQTLSVSNQGCACAWQKNRKVNTLY